MKMNGKLIFLLCFSFLVRLISLDQSLWLDETTTANVVRNLGYFDIISKFSPHDFHPPFFYLLMKFWTNIFGYSEVSLRMPSVLASIVTGYFVYKLAANMKLGKSLGLWASAFFLFNPLIVYYSQEARMYSLTTLFITMIFWSVVKLKDTSEKLKVKTGKFKFLFFTNVFIALSLGTFYGSVFFISSLYLYLVLKREFKLLTYVLPGTVFASILLYPLFIMQLHNSGEMLSAIPNWSMTLGSANLKNLLLIPIKLTSGRISWEPKIYYFATAGLWALFISSFVMLNLFQHLKKIPKQVRNDLSMFYSLLLLPILLGFVVSFYKPLLQYFRFIYVIPFVAILLAISANKNWHRYILIVGFVGFSLLYILNPYFHREDWKSLVQALPSKTVYALPSSIDPISYYNRSIKSNSILAESPTERIITLIPYATEIYGFDYVKKLSLLKYRKIREHNVRGLSYEVWEK